ncbi:MAG: hypothetical protein NWF00_01615 [Candidatus Bathyarchaeota archaeon]|nr:hypothetical protein [Candidatus Bathyarchaeota archaeon]
MMISSQSEDNGCYGFYDTPEKYKESIITVPSTGSIGFANVQLLPCCACDDVLILTPKRVMHKEYLFYIAFTIKQARWRFNYGRKITPYRLGRMRVKSPDEIAIKTSYDQIHSKNYPRKQIIAKVNLNKPKTKRFLVTELFNVERGQFHAIDQLESGTCATVSRVSTDNGVVGFFNKPKRAKVYIRCLLTISTVTGDAFLQTTPFIATDNVLICVPKTEMDVPTLLYIQAMLNHQKWRYSYGRQPYLRIFQKASVELPTKEDDKIDNEYIHTVVSAQPYFHAFMHILSSHES